MIALFAAADAEREGIERKSAEPVKVATFEC
jgi:hypothetical protein